MAVPSHPRIKHLGFVSDETKFDALAAADLLIMPSYFESLSMVTLEAWALGLPVLVNGKCDVLRGQVVRSNAGLYYTSRAEFTEALQVLETHRQLRSALGANGRAYFRRHYAWSVVERKYLEMLEQLRREDREGLDRVLEPLPGWFDRRQCRVPPAGAVLARVPTGPVVPDGSAHLRRAPEPHRAGGTPVVAIEASGRPQAHQILATLSYGDAISNEVLGIQDVLRRAGYDSRIYIQTVDPQVEDLTDDYRYLLDDTNPETVLIHHFSIGSHASRLAFALPSRMILVYHNITPPSYFVGVNPTLVRPVLQRPP